MASEFHVDDVIVRCLTNAEHSDDVWVAHFRVQTHFSLRIDMACLSLPQICRLSVEKYFVCFLYNYILQSNFINSIKYVN